MHIPDGFLDLKTTVTTATLAAGGLGWAMRVANRQLTLIQRPLMGLAAAFIFAAQMINFPIWGGASGHLIGSVLAAVLLGPAAAMVVMCAVLIVQCLLFSDGGLLSLGANALNMAVLAPLSGWAIYYGVTRMAKGPQSQLMAAVFASWCSTVLAALACALELTWSGVAPGTYIIPAMVNFHLLIGVGEGAITGLVLVAIWRTRPELLAHRPETTARPVRLVWWAAAGGICVGIALLVSPHASAWPDGLEKTAELLGFAQKAAKESLIRSPMPDYQLPGVSSAIWSTGLAGVAGTVIAFALSWFFARWAATKAGFPQKTQKSAAG